MHKTRAVVEPAVEGRVLSQTKSVCPECLAVISANRVAREGGIYLEKTCAEHGFFSVLIWEGSEESYHAWNRGATGKDPLPGAKPTVQGCPYDCGLCAEHERAGCCVLLEVTARCNLNCPVCFASAGEVAESASRPKAGLATGSAAGVKPTKATSKPGHQASDSSFAEPGDRAADPSLSEIGILYKNLMKAGGPFNIQLSGGEPTMRDDLPGIIRLGTESGFTFFQLNTNGLRLARDVGYAKQLKEAGLDCVFLQFDGFAEETYLTLRGRNILAEKLRCIEACAEAGLGVVLVPTVVPGVNDSELGAILRFALNRQPGVRGVHFQPVSYFGRCALPQSPKHLTIPAMLEAIERQTDGAMRAADFRGGAAENAYCSFHANYSVGDDGSLSPQAGGAPEKEGCCGSSAQSRDAVARQWQGVDPVGKAGFSDGFEEFLYNRKRNTFAVSGMLFQDAWTLDLDRLRNCHINEADPRFGLVPFCAYNLSSLTGETIYRR